MESFDSIFQRAAERKGGVAALEALLPHASSPEELRAHPDDRYLAEMTKCVFRSGFVWKIIESKWPGLLSSLPSKQSVHSLSPGVYTTGCGMSLNTPRVR